MKNQLSNILEKEIDRRDFLKHVGIALLAVSGVTTLTKTLSNFGGRAQPHGYSAGVYGGKN